MTQPAQASATHAQHSNVQPYRPSIQALFPLELIDAIFLEFMTVQATPLRNGYPKLGWCDEARARAPWILASVSSRWRKHLLATPALWTYVGLRRQLLISVMGKSPDRSVSYVKDVLSRSADLPLDVVLAWEGIFWEENFHGPILAALADSAHRWTGFSIGIPRETSGWIKPLAVWGGCSQLFFVLARRCMKKIKVLEVDLYLTLQVIWDFLTYSPMLESLSLDIRHDIEDWAGRPGRMDLPHLKSLALYNRAAQGLVALPDEFSFPALETLRSSFSSIDALAIIARAAPAVTTLRLDVNALLSALDVQRLAAFKKLRKLEVHHVGPGVHMGTAFFGAIASDAWPALEEVVIFGIDLQPGEANAVLHFVGARAAAPLVLRAVVFKDCTGVAVLQAQVDQLLAA